MSESATTSDVGAAEARDAVVRRQIDAWARRLIDLTRRNRLVNFKPTRRGHVRIVEPDAQAILDRLLSSSGKWDFFMPPDESDDSPDHVTSDAFRLNEFKRTRKEHQVIGDEVDGTELEKTLLGIGRRTRLELEEKGVNILFLAFGFLRWKSVDEQWNSSPLLLLPVELQRESVRDPHRIITDEPDVSVNPALIEKLKHDYRLELPDVSAVEDLTIAQYLESVRR